MKIVVKKANCSSKMERLQKIIAKAGITSRRKAEDLIKEGKIQVDGKTITEMGYIVSKGSIVSYEGKKLSGENKVYFLLNKPQNVLSSVSDDRGRTTVIDLIESTERIFPVGRLDYDTTGVLLLTNDGDFSNALTHPRYHLKKLYEVKCNGILSNQDVNALETGIELEGEMTIPTEVVIIRKDLKKQETDFKITLVEGKNRQIKRMIESLGLRVLKLHRARFGFIEIKDLKVGEYRVLEPNEVQRLIVLAKEGKLE
jgi:23S rRNA pseudouridine2605 synthase